MRARSIVLLGALLLAAAPGAHVEGRFYTLETTALRYNIGSGAFASDSPVRITKPGLDASADRGEGNAKTGQATMRGNVAIHDAGGSGSLQGKGAKPASLTCDLLEVDGKADVYHAAGHVHYESTDRTATADTMILDRKGKKLHLEGTVVLTQGASTARAAVVDVDLKSGRTVSTGSPVILTEPASPAPRPEPAAPNPRPSPSPSP